MAQFVHQYVSALVQGQASAARMLNVNIYGVPRDAWVLNLTQLTLIGLVMKKISEVAPSVTDAVWLDALNHALDQSAELPWPPNLLTQVDPTQPPPIGE